MQPRDTCATCHARNTCWTSNAHNQLSLSRATTKQARAAMTTTKTKNLHFDKNLKAGCVVVVPFASLAIVSQVESKEQKERTTISNFTDTVLMGLDFIDADLKIGLMMSQIV
jgi:hypothetical protein